MSTNTEGRRAARFSITRLWKSRRRSTKGQYYVSDDGRLAFPMDISRLYRSLPLSSTR